MGDYRCPVCGVPVKAGPDHMPECALSPSIMIRLLRARPSLLAVIIAALRGRG
jgi:hypothetical protein